MLFDRSESAQMTSLEDVGRWEIDPAEISVGKELGKGAFGRVRPHSSAHIALFVFRGHQDADRCASDSGVQR